MLYILQTELFEQRWERELNIWKSMLDWILWFHLNFLLTWFLPIFLLCFFYKLLQTLSFCKGKERRRGKQWEKSLKTFLKGALQGKYYSHFTEEKTEVWWIEINSPKLPSWPVTELGFDLTPKPTFFFSWSTELRQGFQPATLLWTTPACPGLFCAVSNPHSSSKSRGAI